MRENERNSTGKGVIGRRECLRISWFFLFCLFHFWTTETTLEVSESAPVYLTRRFCRLARLLLNNFIWRLSLFICRAFVYLSSSFMLHSQVKRVLFQHENLKENVIVVVLASDNHTSPIKISGQTSDSSQRNSIF